MDRFFASRRVVQNRDGSSWASAVPPGFCLRSRQSPWRNAAVPTLWVNGTHDIHYVLDKLCQSNALVQAPRVNANRTERCVTEPRARLESDGDPNFIDSILADTPRRWRLFGSPADQATAETVTVTLPKPKLKSYKPNCTTRPNRVCVEASLGKKSNAKITDEKVTARAFLSSHTWPW